jgi:transcriptional regulator with XRE-family HTH domain
VQILQDLGQALSACRRASDLRQAAAAQQAGSRAETLSRLERGRLAKSGARKLLAVLAVPGLALGLAPCGPSGTLNERHFERRRAGTPHPTAHPEDRA